MFKIFINRIPQPKSHSLSQTFTRCSHDRFLSKFQPVTLSSAPIQRNPISLVIYAFHPFFDKWNKLILLTVLSFLKTLKIFSLHQFPFIPVVIRRLFITHTLVSGHKSMCSFLSCWQNSLPTLNVLTPSLSTPCGFKLSRWPSRLNSSK